VINGVKPGREIDDTLLRTHSHIESLCNVTNMVDGDIVHQRPECTGNGLEATGIRSAMGGRQHRITAHIGANIHEEVPFPEKMQQEGHVIKIMQPAIIVAGGAGHPLPDDQPAALCPGINKGIAQQPGGQLPGKKATHSPDFLILIQRMVGNIGKR
jgi:hypothetical protein